MRNPRATQLLFELSKPGRRAARVPACDVPEKPLAELLPPEAVADAPPPLPELAEPDVIRHFVNLSTQNMSVDTHYVSARLLHDEVQPQAQRARGGHAGLRRICTPISRTIRSRACCTCCMRCSKSWPRSAGCDAVSLQPAAGAQGEMTALLVAAAYFRDIGAAPHARC